MANQDHLDILAKGVEVWNEWRQEHPDLKPDLHRADLQRANIRGVNLNDSNLSEADLRNADLHSVLLHRSDLHGSDLAAANFEGAELIFADFRAANLQGANFRRADFEGANLTYTRLSGADFTHASFGVTILADTDLSEVQGLDSCYHRGPSSIGIDTIYRSQAKIPEVFLRGAGLPHTFISYIHSLVGQPFDFYSCFLSHSTKDQDFADRLYADLQAGGVRCWFAPHDIQGGRKVHEQIDEAIRVYDKLLLILSGASMSSPWVRTEIANAREREMQQNRQMLFPITLVPFEQIKEWKLFDADRGIDSAREIREYFILDFSNWKDHESYQKAFNRLLRDLKTNRGSKSAAAPE